MNTSIPHEQRYTFYIRTIKEIHSRDIVILSFGDLNYIHSKEKRKLLFILDEKVFVTDS